MKPKPFIIRGDSYIDTACVAKINYGKKYVIVKCLRLPAALKNIENSINAYVRGGTNNPNGLYYFLIEHVKNNPDDIFKVEIVLKSDSAYELLKREQIELDNGRRLAGKNFLNNQLTSYIPAYDDDKKMYGWIPPSAVLNFNNWLKKHKKDMAKLDRAKKPAVKRIPKAKA